MEPIAVMAGCMYVPLHTRLSSVVQSHRTGRDQVSDSTPPPPRAPGDFGLKMPILGKNECFMGLSGHLKPPPHFEGAQLKKNMCFLGVDARK